MGVCGCLCLVECCIGGCLSEWVGVRLCVGMGMFVCEYVMCVFCFFQLSFFRIIRLALFVSLYLCAQDTWSYNAAM